MISYDAIFFHMTQNYFTGRNIKLDCLKAKSITRSNILIGKKMKDLKFVSTDISVFFQRPFSLVSGKRPKYQQKQILDLSFFILPLKILLLVLLFAIKLLA